MGCGASAPAVQETSRKEEVRSVGDVAAKAPLVVAASPTVSQLNKPIGNPLTQEVTTESVDNDDDDDAEADGGWKVKRRVSRRLSLDVQKQPGSAQTPVWQT